MVSRLLTFGALLALVALPGSVRAAEESKAKAPTVVVRIKSLDGLVADVKFLARYVNLEEESKQIDGFLPVFLGGKDMPTLDTTRPLGFYGSISANVVDSTGVLLVPVANEQNFVGLLDRLSFNAKKGADGIYEGTADSFPVPYPIYFKFANQYAYFTMRTKTALMGDKLPDPAKVLALAPVGTLSAVFHLDQIPDGLKQIALSAIDMRLAEEQKKNGPVELKSLAALRTDLLKRASQQATGESGQLAITFDVDQKNNELVAEIGLTSKPSSKLAAQITELGQAKSRFAGLAAGKAAFDLLLHFAADEQLRKSLEPVVDDFIKKAVADAKDDGARTFTTRLFQILEPTLKAGDLDVRLVLTGPSAAHEYTAVGGIKLKDAKDLDKFFQDVVPFLPEKDRKKIQLEAATAGDGKIHQINTQGDLDPAVRQTLGNHPLYLAIRPDVILMSAGPDGLKALRDALATRPAAAPVLRLDLAVNRLAPALAQAAKARGDKDGQAFFEKIAKDPIAKEGQDSIRLSIEGGKSLKLRYTAKAEALKYIPRNKVGIPGRE